MATDHEIRRLKLIVGSEMFTDEQLGEVLDAFEGELEDKLDLAAAQVWEIRAGRYHTMVDISESGSSRKMSDLHKNALAMAAYYGKKATEDAVEEPGGGAGRSGTRRIVRA